MNILYTLSQNVKSSAFKDKINIYRIFFILSISDQREIWCYFLRQYQSHLLKESWREANQIQDMKVKKRQALDIFKSQVFSPIFDLCTVKIHILVALEFLFYIWIIIFYLEILVIDFLF